MPQGLRYLQALNKMFFGFSSLFNPAPADQTLENSDCTLRPATG